MAKDLSQEEILLKKEFIPLGIGATKIAKIVQAASAQRRNEGDIVSVSHDALDEMHLGLVRLHESACHLALDGWAPVAPIILRTMLEGVVGALAIVNAARPDLIAFRFFCSYFRIPTTGNREEEWRRDRRAKTRTMLNRLPEEDRQPARDFVNAQTDQPGFWYRPDYEGPSAVLEQFRPGWLVLYRHYASFAHFGFLAPYFYIQDWDRRDPGRRKEPIPICKALLESSVFLSEFGFIRAVYEKLNTKGLTELLTKSKTLADFLR